MSAIGEARGFRARAAKLRAQLRASESLTPEQQAALEREAQWFEDEARFCWDAARQEARADERDRYEPDDYEMEDR